MRDLILGRIFRTILITNPARFPLSPADFGALKIVYCKVWKLQCKICVKRDPQIPFLTSQSGNRDLRVILYEKWAPDADFWGYVKIVKSQKCFNSNHERVPMEPMPLRLQSDRLRREIHYLPWLTEPHQKGAQVQDSNWIHQGPWEDDNTLQTCGMQHMQV